MADQIGLQAGIDKGGQCGRESGHLLRLRLERLFFSRVGFGPGDSSLELAGDGLPFVKDRLNVVDRHLLLEESIGDLDRRLGVRSEDPAQQVVHQQDGQKKEPDPARKHRRALRVFWGGGIGGGWCTAARLLLLFLDRHRVSWNDYLCLSWQFHSAALARAILPAVHTCSTLAPENIIIIVQKAYPFQTPAGTFCSVQRKPDG